MRLQGGSDVIAGRTQIVYELSHGLMPARVVA